MNETSKTLSMVIAACAVLLIAWVSYPTLPLKGPEEIVGRPLFEPFDPLKAANLEIDEYNESDGTLRPFQVGLQNGVWCIPSHENYPADAQQQMGQAASALMDLKVLAVDSDSPGEHEMFGVVDPDPKTLKAGAKGVGTRVVLKDVSGNTLVGLIIGKSVPNKTDQRYVRRIGQDQVYTLKMRTDKLAAKFEDWIEKNLLKMDSLDFKKVEIQDYSVDVLQGAIKQHGFMNLAYDDAADPKWKLTEDKGLSGNAIVDRKLAADEELNATKLDDLKRAFDDLKIIDVRRKPKGLSADLKGSGGLKLDDEAAASLGSHGFYMARMGSGVGLYSNEGEIRVGMKTGVDYVLRFGSLAFSETGPAAKDDKAKDGKKDSAERNRYIFVMAEYNPETLAKPKLDPLPEEPKDEPPADKKDEKKGDKKDGDKKEAKPGEKKDEKKAEPKLSKAEWKAERERVEKENKRKQDEYDAAVKKGQDKVKELNERFADWYYVISDDVYHKIHLARADVVKKKEKKDDKAKTDAGHDHDHDHDHADPAKSSAPENNTPADFKELKDNPPGKKD